MSELELTRADVAGLVMAGEARILASAIWQNGPTLDLAAWWAAVHIAWPGAAEEIAARAWARAPELAERGY